MGVLRVFAFECGVGTSPYVGDLQCVYGPALVCVPWCGLQSDTRTRGVPPANSVQADSRC